jgi:hypothetical protein
MSTTSNWSVRYTDLRDKAARRPFYNRRVVVTAATRREAIDKVKAIFGPPAYGEFSATPTAEKANPLL